MTKHVLLSLFMFAVAVHLHACGDSRSPTVGGETHWLASCTSNEACGGDATCQCGVCTLGCDEASTCSSAGMLTSCAAPSSVAVSGLCDASPMRGLCLPPCTTTPDCQPLGNGFECLDGHCIPSNEVICASQDECPPSSACTDGACRCNPEPVCGADEELRCTTTGDMRLNCMECECLPTTNADLQLYTTCGDPSCSAHRDAGLPSCSDAEVEGASCSDDTFICDPVNDCNSHVVCSDADPKGGVGGCPISRARYKEDIHYLSDREIEQAANELMSIPLATYRYKEADDTHLGFILEDVEPSFATDGARNRVNLYGYISLAVAALKAQDRRIQALEEEIADLRGEPMCEP